MFSYLAYGLGVHSTFPIPELTDADVRCHIDVRFGSAEELPADGCDYAGFFRVTPTEATIAFAHVGTFLVREGREIVVFPALNSDERLVRLALIGTVLAVALYQRGRLALHASAVDVAGCAVAFMGETGWGKSTIAAALHARGHQMIADDVTALAFGDDSALVFPSYPQMKLSAESAAALGYRSESLFELYTSAAKRGWHVAERFQQEPLPLRQIYLLGEADTVQIDRLPAQAALLELIRHSYPTRLLQPGGATHFAQCARLVREIAFYRLGRPRDLNQLHDLSCIVETHLGECALNDIAAHCQS